MQASVMKSPPNGVLFELAFGKTIKIVGQFDPECLHQFYTEEHLVI